MLTAAIPDLRFGSGHSIVNALRRGNRSCGTLLPVRRLTSARRRCRFAGFSRGRDWPGLPQPARLDSGPRGRAVRRKSGILCWALGCAAVAAAPALAHPHIFIDAGLELRFDEAGRLGAVRIVWVYDDFTSLLVLEDRGLDRAGSGALSEAETAALTGFDMNWIEGFAGDTYVLVGDRPVALGGPEEPTAALVHGRIVTTHLRRLPEPLAPVEAPIVVQLYDPTYYTAYTIAADPVILGREDCSAQVFAPDPGAVAGILAQAMQELSGLDLEQDFPAIGAELAEEVRVTCAAR